jgi:hypothetical protein
MRPLRLCAAAGSVLARGELLRRLLVVLAGAALLADG